MPLANIASSNSLEVGSGQAHSAESAPAAVKVQSNEFAQVTMRVGVLGTEHMPNLKHTGKVRQVVGAHAPLACLKSCGTVRGTPVRRANAQSHWT